MTLSDYERVSLFDMLGLQLKDIDLKKAIVADKEKEKMEMIRHLIKTQFRKHQSTIK